MRTQTRPQTPQFWASRARSVEHASAGATASGASSGKESAPYASEQPPLTADATIAVATTANPTGDR